MRTDQGEPDDLNGDAVGLHARDGQVSRAFESGPSLSD
jgi:hypothetical protein